jgi:Arc/MetJ-type ribon-helix-helix transcriptional regulator
MTETVQARLDHQSRQELDRLVRRLGWSPSKVVREAIRLLAACQTADRPKQIVGLGKFASGMSDLGSNKARLKGFGR